jgi:hypothetical protein
MTLHTWVPDVYAACIALRAKALHHHPIKLWLCLDACCCQLLPNCLNVI